jgi:hypothetical protein
MSGPLPGSVHNLTVAPICGIVRELAARPRLLPMYFLADIHPGVNPW